MPGTGIQDSGLDGLQEAVRQAVESGTGVQKKISELMLSGLSSGDLDLPRVREVTRAVLQGVATAVDQDDNLPSGAIRQSIAGVEEALQKTAEASRLAVQEMAGRVAGFTRQDLKKALDDLGAIEVLFMETLGEIARSGTATAAVVFGDFLEHMRRSGTDLGTRLQDIINGLGVQLPVQDGGLLQAGAQSMEQAGRQLAKLAGAILAGTGSGQSGTPDRPDDNRPDDNRPDDKAAG